MGLLEGGGSSGGGVGGCAAAGSATADKIFLSEVPSRPGLRNPGKGLWLRPAVAWEREQAGRLGGMGGEEGVNQSGRSARKVARLPWRL